MQLGRGNVYLYQQLPFEAVEGKALPNAFEDSLVEEEEGFPFVGTTVHAHGFALSAGANRDIGVTLSPERPTLELRFAI